jgi:hypothetical protein
MFARAFKRLLISLVVVVLGVGLWDVATYDREAWLADYARIKRDMAQGYANLDWMIERRGVDVAALDRATTQRIDQAHSRVRAFLALKDFVRAFDDPHLRIEPGKRPAPESTPAAMASATDDAVAAEPTDTPAGADCASSGYEDGDHAFRFPFAAMDGWKQVSTGEFPSGLVGDVGIVRIAQFGENQYLGACNAVHRAGIGERALQLATRARLQAQLRGTLDTLRQRGAQRLLIDVTGNGGGSEWVSEVVALMTDRTLTRSEARRVAPTCDRTAVWTGTKPACKVFADRIEQASIAGTGGWRGPVFVLVDGGTASAAEDLVAWLQQNRVAKVIGERTLGAGCGYVDGGTTTHLSQVPLDVRMPNCARFMADGTNEVEGIAPDFPLSQGDDDVRAKGLSRWLAIGAAQ